MKRVVKNKLEVMMRQSKFAADKHFAIVIDDVALDEWLHHLYPSRHLLGMIPTLFDWIDDPDTTTFLQSRYQSAKPVEILPIMICPDDCDLSCTVIVAKVVQAGEHVIWEQVGIDHSDISGDYQWVGSQVEWLTKVPPLVFDKAGYYAELNKIYG